MRCCIGDDMVRVWVGRSWFGVYRGGTMGGGR